MFMLFAFSIVYIFQVQNYFYIFFIVTYMYDTIYLFIY